jgi:putative hydrolase of the HAD superfamily
MIIVFDLDDTLYDEMTYVKSGLRAVSDFGLEEFGLDSDESYQEMIGLLSLNGRGKVFDDWLSMHGVCSRVRVLKCLQVYRNHTPIIKLFPKVDGLLHQYRNQFPIYMVTDGHKLVQKKKIDALGIGGLFNRVFITHRFGVVNAKPSLYCFEIIMRMHGCSWAEMVYVGDNPKKDFVNLNKVGAQTIRVKTGSFAFCEALPGYDAKKTIPDISYLGAAIV